MSAPETHSHELVLAFAQAGLALDRRLVEMLDEHFSHHTERRGCGYTQATRYLSTRINQPRDPLSTEDLGIFAHWSQGEAGQVARIAHAAGWARGWRGLDEAPAALLEGLPALDMLARLRRLPAQLRAIRAGLARQESQLLAGLIEHVLSGAGPAAPELRGMPEKADIGSCSQAEEFFLEIAHARVRRHGAVNVFHGAAGEPLIVEKIQLGESHSGMVVSPVRINGVLIPPGSLCALRYPDPPACGRKTRHGMAYPFALLAEARFLRLTTLAVPPEIRQRAFSVQIDAQLRSDFFSPLGTTIEQLRAFAESELADAA